MALTLPPDTIVEAIHGPVTKVTRRVAFFESDGATPWQPGGEDPFLIEGGKVSLDHARDERRIFDCVIDNTDGRFKTGPGGLWYDKVVKIYRGVETATESWERQLGEFLIDNLNEPHHPGVVALDGRDFSKKLVGAEFAGATLFPENHPIEEVVRDIAVSGGVDISRMNLPLTGKSLGRDYLFDAGMKRWEAIKEVSTSYGYEVFFDNIGQLTMRAHADPYLDTPEYIFKTGIDGNLAEYNKKSTDARLRNHIVVTGENADQIPVYAEAENTDAGSPTNTTRLGKRTYRYQSAFIETVTQAQNVADDFLKVMALEQFDIDLTAIVVPYIDVGVTVEFQDPDPLAGDPTKYLLGTVDIPLALEGMAATAGRVISV